MIKTRRVVESQDLKYLMFWSGVGPSLDSYELSRLMGYRQPGSLRKQILTDWKEDFTPGQDYELVHTKHRLQTYNVKYQQVWGKFPSPPQSPKRGRLFLSASGITKVVQKSSKPLSEELKRSLIRRELLNPTAPKKAVSNLDTKETGKTPVLSTHMQYEVMQTLIGHLERLTDPGLRKLAIEAAELRLGKKLSYLNPPASEETTAPQRLPDDGPLFEASNFWSMTRIGEKAGGYTARQAGKALDIVARRVGYSHDQIRKEKCVLNEIVPRPDSTSGKLRLMCRFHTDFANEVVRELRANPNFVPEVQVKDNGAEFTVLNVPNLNQNIL